MEAISLFFRKSKLLDYTHKPSLYLSAHLEKHHGTYYDALTRVRKSNDIGHWVRFFLQAIVETAENGKKTFRRILDLKQELEQEVVKLGHRAENARQMIMYLYGTPTITVNKAMELLKIKYVPAPMALSQPLLMRVFCKKLPGIRETEFLFSDAI